jgi:hypothetical protein
VRAIPAAGHIAGLYGRTDGRRGVWKVAAGIEASITGAVGLDFQILDRDQDRMNPHGLNALRTIPGAGRVVWGGRTGRPTTEWRYINVRRTAMFLRRSIFNGIQWAVFEGNDERLWAALRASIGAFILGLGIAVYFAVMIYTYYKGEKVGRDPWDGRTLEWSLPNPPPEYNFRVIPTVHATPVTPRPLLPTAPTVPAVCVPCAVFDGLLSRW